MREVALPQAAVELLEPLVQLEIEVPSECQGGIVGNLSRKRAQVTSSQDDADMCRITAQAPLAEMLDYANEIRTLTQCEGNFTMEPCGYQPMPGDLVNAALPKMKLDSPRKRV